MYEARHTRPKAASAPFRARRILWLFILLAWPAALVAESVLRLRSGADNTVDITGASLATAAGVAGRVLTTVIINRNTGDGSGWMALAALTRRVDQWDQAWASLRGRGERPPPGPARGARLRVIQGGRR